MHSTRNNTRRARRRLIDKSHARREGKRFYAFYRGARDRRAGERVLNPFPPGSQDAAYWEAGREYANDERNSS